MYTDIEGETMVTIRQLVRPTLVRFLPTVTVVMLVIPLVEPIIRGHDVLTSLKHLYLPLVVGEPLLMAVGYAAGLWLIRNRLNPQTVGRPSLHITAAVVAIFGLGITSVFSQGAHMAFIVAASVAAGLVVALLFFGSRPSVSAVTSETTAASA